jgi:hypothetical protein
MLLLIRQESVCGGTASKQCTTNLFTSASEDILKQLNHQGDLETELCVLMGSD